MDKINDKQIKKIWAMSHKAGLSRDDLYVIVESIAPDAPKKENGEISLSKIKYGQAWRLIDTLHRKMTPAAPAAIERISKKSGVLTIITPAQKEYINDLIEYCNEGREIPILPDRFCQRNYGKAFNTISRFQAASMIEALKAIFQRSNKL
jgi:hypothetical protein